jgi:hypothetical protein
MIAPRRTDPAIRRTLRSAQRRGMTVLVVLMLISVTLALSYVVLRGNVTAVQIQANSSRQSLARQAAFAGLSVALRKMHQTGWTGVDVPIGAALSATESYTATYTTGDPALTPASADYPLYPLRVTVLATGTAVEAGNAQLVSTHKVRAVVQLVPRALGTTPSGWSTMQAYTLYQLDDDDARFELPFRVEGPVRLQGALRLGEGYAWPSDAREKYFADLRTMHAGSLGDYRPFTSTISLPTSQSAGWLLSLLSGSLGLVLNNIPITSPPDLLLPDSLAQYRLYAGGKQYNVPQLSGTIQNRSLAPDPLANPLGVYFCNSSVTLGSNVTVLGTLVASSDVSINASSVQVTPHNLPNVSGATSALRMPALAVKQKFKVEATGGGTVQGVVIARDRFEIVRGPAAASFGVVGRVITDEPIVDERSEWDVSGGTWLVRWGAFLSPITNPPAGHVDYWPVWLERFGQFPQPLLTIKPDSATYTAHWQDLSQPLYVPAAGDPGLRWDLVSWQENP